MRLMHGRSLVGCRATAVRGMAHSIGQRWVVLRMQCVSYATEFYFLEGGYDVG